MSKFKKTIALVLGAAVLVSAIAGCAKKVPCYKGTPVPDFIAVTDLDDSNVLDGNNSPELAQAEQYLSQIAGGNLDCHFYQNITMDNYMTYLDVLFDQHFDSLYMPDTENSYYTVNSNAGVYIVIVYHGGIEERGLMGVYTMKMTDDKMDDDNYADFVFSVADDF